MKLDSHSDKILIITPIVKGRILSSLFCIIVLTSACVQEDILDDVQNKYFQPQLAIHSLLSPGDSIFVNVGKSLSLGDSTQTAKVTNAVVTLTNELGNTVSLPLVKSDYFTTVYGLDQQAFPVQPGHTYTLSVTHPELPTVRAECTVPSTATALEKVEYVGQSAVPDDDRLLYDVQMSWHDDGLYLHRVYIIDRYQEINPENDSILEEGESYHSHDPIHGIERVGNLFTYQYGFFSGGVYYPDQVVSDSLTTTDLNTAIKTATIHRLTVYLLTPDEHMARYQESLDFFSRNRDALSASSFIELYRGVIPENSNVRGGLGVFGAYLRSAPHYLVLS